MSWIKRTGVGLAGLVLAVLAAGFAFQARIGLWMFERGVEQRIGMDRLSDFPEGLHVGLCGTGSPMPSLDRAGPCNVVIAGDQVFVVDIGEGANEVLNIMGISAGDVDAAMLTHFHSDHIDGMGPFMLFHWTRGTATAPVPVYGPAGVEAIVAGFNKAYATDKTYRIAHHGEEVVPASGGGAEARAFEMTGDAVVVLERGGLKVTAFRVDHDPVSPAVGYRFDYKGRSVCISGDTDKSSNLERACKGVDVLVHEALQPRMVKLMQKTAEKRGQSSVARIFFDIQDYHASPEDAARSAKITGARMLVLSHLVPAMPSRALYPAFLGDAESRYDGPIVVGEDGMMISLPPNGTRIDRSNLL